MYNDVRSADRFTRAHVQLCERIAAQLTAERDAAAAAAWLELSRRIETALERRFVRFTKGDLDLIGGLHVATLRNPLADGTKERSRELSALGVLVVYAQRGQLEQLREARA